ncbi:VOC family protein [Rhodococcoides yunnanense]|uniref:VOC family protein n=1 Tax=Rhodococcoides yunnanense TaxID=278209 RepID=UPI00093483DF|nr:VOC family protein [Rhodococcus yunnanensis]
MTETTGNRSAIWPCFRYEDPRAAIRFIVEVLGFTEAAVYGEGDRVDHAELRWPGGGGVMLGSVKDGDPPGERPGVGSVYVVTSEPDAVFERVVRAGARVTRPMREEDYGSRGFTCGDPEGVQWSFGTYAGAE